jgi:virulence factor Mce-like protein
MSRGRGTASIVASPVLVGAVTTLIVIVSVFLAYNANTGLPFVPTYNISAQLPGGANLVKGNEVRVGGFRVGIISKIRPGIGNIDGERRGLAVVDLKLDKTVEPVSTDTTLVVRPRSALGLKYIELTPGKSDKKFAAGDTIPIKSARTVVEFDDLLNTFDSETRQSSQDALTGYGNAFAGRGSDVNELIASLNPFFRSLTPVMKNLSNPRTGLKDFFKEIGETSAEVAPVAREQAELFSNMADTLAAIGRCADCLRDTISKTPPTQDTAIRSFQVQRPFLADFADLSRRLRPAVAELPTALPALNSAFRVGTPVVKDSVRLNERTADVFRALDDLAADPNTLLALKDLRSTVTVTAPLLGFISPYQTVCNYGTIWFNALGSHMSEDTANGTTIRTLAKMGSSEQDNNWGEIADIPADLKPGDNPRNPPKDAAGNDLQAQHTQPYAPAIDAQGNADCQVGQFGFPRGPLNVPQGRYTPGQNGGNFTVNAPDTPGLAGTTFTGRKNLSEVP